MENPLVGILMGSDSDLPVMAGAAALLEEFTISYETKIMSAHRTPDQAAEYARTAATRGMSVIIAGAGQAAHLAGVIAAHTPLPVVGVPIRSGALEGMDALYSTVQMPPGIPVATVGINGAKNAALLAVQILGTASPEVQNRIVDYKQKLAAQVKKKDDRLQSLGIEKYLSEKGE